MSNMAFRMSHIKAFPENPRMSFEEMQVQTALCYGKLAERGPLGKRLGLVCLACGRINPVALTPVELARRQKEMKGNERFYT